MTRRPPSSTHSPSPPLSSSLSLKARSARHLQALVIQCAAIWASDSVCASSGQEWLCFLRHSVWVHHDIVFLCEASHGLTNSCGIERCACAQLRDDFVEEGCKLPRSDSHKQARRSV